MMGRSEGAKMTKEVRGQFECSLVGMRRHRKPLNRTSYDTSYFLRRQLSSNRHVDWFARKGRKSDLTEMPLMLFIRPNKKI